MGWQTSISQKESQHSWNSRVCISKSSRKEHVWDVCISWKKPPHCVKVFHLVGCLLHSSNEDPMSPCKTAWLFPTRWNHSASIIGLPSITSLTQDELECAWKPVMPVKDLVTKGKGGGSGCKFCKVSFIFSESTSECRQIFCHKRLYLQKHLIP